MSAEKDLFELILVRWDVRSPWSPWNCILLTKDEAQAHTKLEDPEMVGINQNLCMYTNNLFFLTGLWITVCTKD